MEKWIFLGALVIIVILRMRPAKGIKMISTEELKGILNDKDKVFIDVRTPSEYKTRHIRQFKNIPLGADFSGIPKDKEIVVICQSGMRSARAAKQLKRLGYKKITNVKGGMNAWMG